MTVPSDTGYVDYTQKGAIPTVGVANVDQPVQDTTDLAVSPRMYAENPSVSKMKMWGSNGYYMNGPYFDPLNQAVSRYNNMIALSEGWNETKKRESLNNFFSLSSVSYYLSKLLKNSSTSFPSAIQSMKRRHSSFQ